MPVFAYVTAGTVCPAAIYVVRTIYNHTNNDVPIQYHSHTSPPLSFIHLYSPQTPMLSVTAGHIPPQYMSFVQFTPPQTTMCLYNITPTHHPHTSPSLSFIHLYSPQTPMLSVTAGHIPPPIFVYMEYVSLPTTLCR